MKTITAGPAWKAHLEEFSSYDFYHTFDYHKLECSMLNDGSTPYLFSYQGERIKLALPLVIRGGEVNGHPFVDATSVYGYAGPLASNSEIDAADARDFCRQLEDALYDLNVTAVFSRLHPLLRNESLLSGLGVCDQAGETVFINLEDDDSVQKANLRNNHKRDIRKLHRLGVTCEISTSDDDIRSFTAMYNSTMQRVSARDSYLYPEDYYREIVGVDDFGMNLFVCRLDARPICAGLFSDCRGIIQYHLGGTDENFIKLAPTKLMFDTVRNWGSRRGRRVLHLGGGVGGRNDSVLKFKRGFSNRQAMFFLWKWVLDESKYEALCAAYAEQMREQGMTSVDTGYFPSYRAPAEHLVFSD